MKKTWRWQVAQFLELNWWKHYLSNKPQAAYLEWKKNYWHKTLVHVQEYFTFKQGDRVLDAGCGPAGIFMVLEEQQVDAIDPLIEAYEEKLPHFSPEHYKHVAFRAARLESIEADREYDVVCCMNAINHVIDVEESFDKLVDAAKEGGHVLISIDTHNYNFFKHLCRWIPGDLLHPHHYDLEEYKEMLDERGCEIKKAVNLKEGFLFNHYLVVAQTWECQ